jgi:hypothetical protein
LEPVPLRLDPIRVPLSQVGISHNVRDRTRSCQPT